MKKYTIGIISVLSAISLSICAASYSIFGLAKLFSGASQAVIIMATSLEIAKIVTIAAVHLYWEELDKRLRIYLVSATIILMLITSMGIYGFLSDAYSQTKFKDDITERKLDIIRLKKNRFDEQITNFQNEKNTLNNDMNKLRENMSVSTQTQKVDEKTGQLLTNTYNGNKTVIKEQLETISKRRDYIETQINPLQDSSSKLEVQLIEVESSNTTSSELGPLKYISKITTTPMDKVVNWFLLLLIIVFDPLALALLILAIDIFKIKVSIVPNEKTPEKKTPEKPSSKPTIVPEPKPKQNVEPIIEDIPLDEYPVIVEEELPYYDNVDPFIQEDIIPEILIEEIKEKENVIENVSINEIVETPTHMQIQLDERTELPSKKERVKKTPTKRTKPITVTGNELPPAITNHLARSVRAKNTPHQQIKK
jgi:membrane-bound metal-dependent hydrolase YbcI (DUF457 family)